MYKNTAAIDAKHRVLLQNLVLTKKTSDLKFMNCIHKTFNVIWVPTCLASFIFSSSPFMMPFHFLLVHTGNESLTWRKLLNTEDTNTHTYPCTNTTKGSQLQLACPFRCNLEGFCNIKQRYITGRFMYSVSPVQYGSTCTKTVNSLQIRIISRYLTVNVQGRIYSLYKLTIICNVENS
jgi:hypothetical protein